MRAIPLKIKGKKFASELFEKGTYNSVIIQFIYLIGGALVSHGAVFGSYAPFGAAFCAAVPYKNALSAVVGSIFGYILLPWEIDYLYKDNSRIIVYFLMIIFYLLFYYYQMHMAWGLF